MPGRLRDRAKFLLERLLLRGAHYRLLIIIGLIGLLSVAGGAVVQFAGGAFDSFGDAVWWAFLRLSDPGYLGDDTGTLRRTVSTLLTVLGYVVFLGALVAIMTQWLNATMRRLESGFTPIAIRDHVLILGWTEDTPTIVRELLQSGERARRFLRRRGARALRIVILADEVAHELWQELRDELGPLFDEGRIILRSGSHVRIEHLRRVAFLDASAILLPPAGREAGQADPDTRTIKTLLSMSAHTGARREALPLAVVGLRDERVVAVADQAWDGPLEPLTADAIVSRLIAQNIRHPGLSHVYGELLAHGRGNELYVREYARFTGSRLQDLAPCFPHAILIGVVRGNGDGYEPRLNPPDGFVVEAGDRLVLLARDWAHTDPVDGAPVETPRAAATSPPVVEDAARRVLVIGWSQKVPALVAELDECANEPFDMDIISPRPIEERERELERHAVAPRHARLRQIVADPTVPQDMRHVDAGACDAIVLMGTDRLESGEEADARTILSYLLLRELVGDGKRPHVIVELLDAANAALFRHRTAEVLISPLVMSHMLAQVVLRRELRAVFDELFGPGNTGIFFHPPVTYGTEGVEITFAEIERRAAARGETALGVQLAQAADRPVGCLLLNPSRAQTFVLSPDDDVVVLGSWAS